MRDILAMIDEGLDQAAADGRLLCTRPDPKVREVWRWLRQQETHYLIPPPPRAAEPANTAVLVMDRPTRRELREACRRGGETAFGVRIETYAGIPIKVDDDCEGRIFLVTLKAMGS